MHEQDLLCITDSVVGFFLQRHINHNIETLFYSLGTVFYRLASLHYTV